MKKTKIGQKIISRLKDFTKRLESGEEIDATLVERFSTPDGPMTVKTPVEYVLRRPE